MNTYLIKIGLNTCPRHSQREVLRKAGWQVSLDGREAVLQLRAPSGGAAGRVARNAVPPAVRHLVDRPTAVTPRNTMVIDGRAHVVHELSR